MALVFFDRIYKTITFFSDEHIPFEMRWFIYPMLLVVIMSFFYRQLEGKRLMYLLAVCLPAGFVNFLFWGASGQAGVNAINAEYAKVGMHASWGIDTYNQMSMEGSRLTFTFFFTLLAVWSCDWLFETLRKKVSEADGSDLASPG